MSKNTEHMATLAADVVVLAADDTGRLHVLVIERGWPPYAGCYALPGGLVDPNETFEQAARRELVEETGVVAPAQVVRVGVYDAPGRDPRGRVISVAYCATLPGLVTPTAGDDATAARWVPITAVGAWRSTTPRSSPTHSPARPTPPFAAPCTGTRGDGRSDQPRPGG